MDTQTQVLDRLRSAFNSGITVPEQFRRTQLTKLTSLIKENEELLLNALHKDLAKVQDCAHVTPTTSSTRSTHSYATKSQGLTVGAKCFAQQFCLVLVTPIMVKFNIL